MQVWGNFLKNNQTQSKWPQYPQYLNDLNTSCPQYPGGTDLERGYGDVRPWRPPFHASPAARKGPISSKRVSSQDPLLRKFGNFSLYSIFCPNFSSQAPKFENFELTSPQIWKLSAHNPPNLEIFSSQAPLFRGKYPFASPTLASEIWAAHPYLKKKLSAPPPRASISRCVLCFCFNVWYWNKVWYMTGE